MSEELEEKAVEVIDKAMDGMDQLTAMLAEVAEKYGPEVVDAGLNVARISAASILIHATVGLILLFALFRVGIPLTLKFRATIPDRDKNDIEFWGPTLMVWLFIGGLISSVGLGAFGALKIFNLWNWVGIIEPKLWIAHRVLNW